MQFSPSPPPHKSSEIQKVQRYALIGTFLWTLLLSGLFIAFISDSRQTVHEIGHSMAVASFEKDILFRRWGAMHGGVYVPETAVTPANPYLATIPERDITTPSGRHLTLINPAYMTRQIFELARTQTDSPQGHITSLNPIRPENVPDLWETNALKKLEGGATEVEESVQINSQPHLRFMRPLVTETTCLKCHAAQGYKEGDNRGGISVTVSLIPIQKTLHYGILKEAAVHLLIWSLGMLFIWFATRKIIITMTSLSNERSKQFESEEQLRVIFEASESGIIMVSQQGNIVFANRRMAEMFDMTLQDLIGTHYREHLHATEKIFGDERMRQIIKGEVQSITLDRHYIRTDGTDFWGHLSGRRLENPDGTLRALVGVISDITERKRAEEERQQLEQQFHHSQKMESLGVLAGGIAHDFNNILTVILGHCYMAKVDNASIHEYKSSFTQIENAGNRAADLCRQMLTYAGKSPLVQTQVNLWLLVDEVVKMLQSAINKNITIERDMKQRVPEIKGDKSQIQQIAMNLIINAAEAIGDAHGLIRVALHLSDISGNEGEVDTFGSAIKAGKYACLEVTDSGEGMSLETQKRIFEPFYTTKFTGRGLGMSTIRGIITSHEAIMQLTSTIGVGTTFKVFFPVSDPSEYTELSSSVSSLPKKTGGTILLVEDEQTLRDMSSELLSAMGFTVLVAIHGREAIEMFHAHGSKIDVILMDLIMPVMGGIDAYHELRGINITIPVIICSGYGVEAVSEIIENDQHAGFMHKPYKPDFLHTMIVEMMNSDR